MSSQLVYDHVVRREWLPAFAIAWLSLSSLLVILRLTLRATGRNSALGLDDALLLPSWIFYIAFTSVAIFASNSGFIDRHTRDLLPSSYRGFVLTAWLSEFFFLVGTCCLKISVLLFFRRLVKDLFERRWQIAIWAGIIFNVTYTATFVIVLALSFRCVEQTADTSKDNVSICYHTPRIVLTAGVFSTISDAYAIILPWIVTRRLSLPVRQRIALNVIFLSSSLIIVAACFRTTALVKFHKMQDPSWNGFNTNVAAIAEWSIGIICACIPSLRSLFRTCKGFHLSRRSSCSRGLEHNGEAIAAPRLYQHIEPQGSILVDLKRPETVLSR